MLFGMSSANAHGMPDAQTLVFVFCSLLILLIGFIKILFFNAVLLIKLESLMILFSGVFLFTLFEYIFNDYKIDASKEIRELISLAIFTLLNLVGFIFSGKSLKKNRK